MRRPPFLSNAARRGLLLLEWIVILAVLGGFIYSWHEKGELSEQKKKSLPDVTYRQTAPSSVSGYAVAEEKVETFLFDPNTADSTTLLRLGLAPWQVRSIYKYRAKHGRYHTPEDFKRLPGMTYELWERLGPQIRIARQFQYIDEREKRPSSSYKPAPVNRQQEQTDQTFPEEQPRNMDTVAVHPRKYQTLTLVDVNTADTTELMRIPGIGSYRSNRIVRYRQQLGGYVNTEQVMEACELPDDILPWLCVLEGTPVKKINVNKLSLQRLMSHPYISFYQARAVVEYRKAFGDLKSVEELNGLEGFTSQKIEKLQPYLEF